MTSERHPTIKDLEHTPKFQRRLLAWYDIHKRDLPWRLDRDPYRVWLSEIMLQQTRVNAVVEYYRRFLERFPTVEKLAGAREASVLAAWSGLGYYRRARMLHAAAKMVVKERSGKFPATAEGLRALPGIGRYTAAAVASIAFDEPTAVVDGNVERVLERVSGNALPGERVWEGAQGLLDRQRPGDFNQAMMELGATICLPRNPTCASCPVMEFCGTRGELQKGQKDERRSKREICYTLNTRNGFVFLVKRSPEARLMPGMWELPEAAASGPEHDALTLRHSITVTDYTVRVTRGPAPRATSGKWIAGARLGALPLTGLARKILRASRVL
jgi:A/G-specific adenine glycosylase